MTIITIVWMTAIYCLVESLTVWKLRRTVVRSVPGTSSPRSTEQNQSLASGF